jgi:hypothetical protein
MFLLAGCWVLSVNDGMELFVGHRTVVVVLNSIQDLLQTRIERVCNSKIASLPE